MCGTALDQAAGSLALTTVTLSALTILTTKHWRGHATGKSLGAAHLECASAGMLLCSCLALSVVYMWRLCKCPKDAGSQSELDVISVGFVALWWTQFVAIRPLSRRKRRLAALLAGMPTFRQGRYGYNSPISSLFKEAIERLPGYSEVVVRSAHPHLRPRLASSTHNYFRGLARAVLQPLADAMVQGELDGTRNLPAEQPRSVTVLLYDAKAQDEAGAELLCPEFTHPSVIRNHDIAKTVWDALSVSRVWLMLTDAMFEWDVWHTHKRTIRDILAGPMFTKLSIPADQPQGHATAARVLWALIQLEALEYMHQDGAWADPTPKEPPLLTFLEQEPVKLLRTVQKADAHQKQDAGAYTVLCDDNASSWWLTDFRNAVFGVLQVKFSRMTDTP